MGKSIGNSGLLQIGVRPEGAVWGRAVEKLKVK